MRIHSLIAAFATVPALWLTVSFLAPAKAADAYIPPVSAFKTVVAASQPISMAVVAPGIEDAP